MTSWSLSALSPVDIDPIVDIEGRSFGWPWGRLSFEGEADSPGAGSWVVRTPGPTGVEQVVAYIFFRLIADEVHIFRIAVAPEWRRRGIGAQLVAECLGSATRRGARVALLEVRPSSTRPSHSIASSASGSSPPARAIIQTVVRMPSFYKKK